MLEYAGARILESGLKVQYQRQDSWPATEMFTHDIIRSYVWKGDANLIMHICITSITGTKQRPSQR